MTQPNVDELAQSIASDTGVPRETVSAMVSRTWQAFSDGAHVTDSSDLIVRRRAASAPSPSPLLHPRADRSSSSGRLGIRRLMPRPVYAR